MKDFDLSDSEALAKQEHYCSMHRKDLAKSWVPLLTKRYEVQIHEDTARTLSPPGALVDLNVVSQGQKWHPNLSQILSMHAAVVFLLSLSV